jgi:hypothetical protein
MQAKLEEREAKAAALYEDAERALQVRASDPLNRGVRADTIEHRIRRI